MALPADNTEASGKRTAVTVRPLPKLGGSGSIDTTYDVRTDAGFTRAGVPRDPDPHSRTLQRYHQILWSKPLPSGRLFELTPMSDGSLWHQSDLGEFWLTSDGIVHTYSNRDWVRHLEPPVSEELIEDFVRRASTIAGYIVFPGDQRDHKPTVNGARGMNRLIDDRFDLTLECIRRHYLGAASPLRAVLARYADFFDLFVNFNGYIEFFLLQDLVAPGGSVDFFQPFSGYDGPPNPRTTDFYLRYMEASLEFIDSRNRRIDEWSRVNRTT